MKQIDFSKTGFGTTAIHAGQKRDPEHSAIATPIFQTTNYSFETVKEASDAFVGISGRYDYSRIGNPTVRILENKMAVLEGSEDALCTGSGMAAINATLLALVQAGDHVIAADTLYGGTDTVMRKLLPKLDIATSFVDTHDLQAVEAAFRPETKLFYLEAAANPTMKVTDIAEIAKIAHRHGAKVIVDNTFTPPPICRPLALGADISLHSMTKYLNGHGDVVAGVVCGAKADLKLIYRCLSDLSGASLSAQNAYLIIRGMKTLELRLQRHSDNAKGLCAWLEQQPWIEKVYNPCLPSCGIDHEIAQKQFDADLTSGMIAFECCGYKGHTPFEVAETLLNNLTIPAIAVSLGDPDSLIQHPAGMTHSNVPEEERLKEGITNGMVRMSVGLENLKDLIDDFAAAAEVL